MGNKEFVQQKELSESNQFTLNKLEESRQVIMKDVHLSDLSVFKN